MSANLVARESGWRMRDWAHGERDTEDAFRSLETFSDRFGELLAHVRGLGFTVIDLWTAHLHWRWATDEHLEQARALLDRHGLRVASIAGGFGETAPELDRACRVAAAVGAPVLGGMFEARADAPEVVAVLRSYDLQLALENHPREHTPDHMRRLVGDGGGGSVGTTVDTGWWATHGVDPERAIEELAAHILHVHLKDVRARGAHETCRWGEGVVPVERCVAALRRIGYEGAISVEHEPPDEDPSDACRFMREALERWLA